MWYIHYTKHCFGMNAPPFDAESGIQNMLNAIQAGILPSSTKERLEQLEETKRELEARIAEEKLAKPKIKEEFIRFNRKGRFGILF